MSEKWAKVCNSDELEDGKTRLFDIEGTVVMVARENGDIYGVSGICTHDGEAMDEDDVEDGEIECGRHGARFSIKTGEVTQMPAEYGLAKCDVKIENGFD